MRNHDWCRDIRRDEAVRASEEGRSGPLPTLEAVIAQPFASQAKCSPSLSESGETQSGLRTERVTLEITHSVPVGLWDWTHILETYRPGESVRVVEEAHFDDLANMSLERDAAIQQHSRECVKCSALADKVIGLKARVASLESQLESVACRAATAENRVAELESTAKAAADANADGESNHAAPAASGAAGPVAWMCEWADHTSFYDSLTLAEAAACGDIVPQPLYRLPPQAASVAAGTGWLTADDRRTLSETAYVLDDRKAHAYARFVRKLLARSSPPEVVLPPMVIAYDDMEMLKEALAAAGVKVKEVG